MKMTGTKKTGGGGSIAGKMAAPKASAGKASKPFGGKMAAPFGGKSGGKGR